MNPVDVLKSVVDELLGALQEDQLILMPFEPHERLLWGLQRGLEAAAGPTGWAAVADALPTVQTADELKDLLAGVAEGVALAIGDAVRERLELVHQAIAGLLSYYSLVYDVNVWVEMLRVWTAPAGTGVESFAQFLRADYPNLYEALVSYRGFLDELDKLVKSLTDSSPAGSRPWSVSEVTVATWAAKLAVSAGSKLQPSVAELIRAKGDEQEQGRQIGRVVARVIIEAILAGLDIYQLARAAERAAGKAVVGVSNFTRVEKVTSVVESQKHAANIAVVGQKVGKGSQAAAVKLYEELATEIAQYKRLSVKTGAFNSNVRELCQLSITDVEYVALRLDSQHIVEATWYKAFPDDFKRIFGWQSSDDMDAIALHTEWHIRSGEKLHTNLNLFGAESEKSLTKALQDFLKARQTRADGTFVPFKNIEELFVAHRDFYRSYTPRLSSKLEAWFETQLTKIRVR